MGHTIGTTASATILGIAIPLGIHLLPVGEAQALYRDGFRFSALAVVLIMMSGSLVTIFQRGHRERRGEEAAAPQPAGDG